MRNSIVVIALLVLFVAWGRFSDSLTGYAATPTPTSPANSSPTPAPSGSPTVATVQAVDPAALQQQQLDAVNRGDVAGAMALFSDNPTFLGGGTCPLTPCVGRAAVQNEIEHQVANHSKLTRTSVQVSGTTVTGRIEVRGDNFTAAGVQRITGSFVVETQGNRISAVRLTLDLSDAQTAQFIRSLTTPKAVTAPTTGTGNGSFAWASQFVTIAAIIAGLGIMVLGAGVVTLQTQRS